MAWLKGIAPYLLLGPLTGPLAFGLVECLKARRVAMAAVYAIGIAEVWLGLPAVLARELAFVAAHAA